MSTGKICQQQRQSQEIEEIIVMVRLNLYNWGFSCGDRAIRRKLEAMQVSPLPSLRNISRVLSRHGLTHQRTGRYESG